jgi:hypothetical protein
MLYARSIPNADMRRMQIVKWTEHVQDRPKWKVIVEKAKTLPEL